MTLTCVQCATPNPGGNRFCGRCGAPLPPSPANRGDAPLGPTCRQCATPVADAPWCPRCGATTGAGTVPPGPPAPAAATPSAPPVSPATPAPPPATPAPPNGNRGVSPAVLTVAVAIAIVVVLAVLGVVLGQSL